MVRPPLTRFQVVGSAVLAACLLASVGSPAAAWAQESKPSAPASSDKVDLRPKFKAGAQTRFRMNLDMTSTQAAGEAGNVEQTAKQELGLLLKVREVSEGGAAQVDMVYESIKLDATSPLLSISFDSSQPKDKDDQTDALLRPLVGLTLALETDEQGNIVKVTPQAAGGGSVSGPLQDSFTAADVVKGLFGPILSISAGNGYAKVGDSWVNESAMQGPLGSMTVRNTYTLRAHNDASATLDIAGTVGLTSPATGGVADIKDGSIKGVASWDTREGMLKSMEMTQRMTITTRLGQQSATSTQNTTVRIDRR